MGNRLENLIRASTFSVRTVRKFVRQRYTLAEHGAARSSLAVELSAFRTVQGIDFQVGFILVFYGNDDDLTDETRTKGQSRDGVSVGSVCAAGIDDPRFRSRCVFP
jgi:hypothetical protein